MLLHQQLVDIHRDGRLKPCAHRLAQKPTLVTKISKEREAHSHGIRPDWLWLVQNAMPSVAFPHINANLHRDWCPLEEPR